MAPKTGLGVGLGCGVGVGVGVPVRLAGVPLLGDAAAGLARGVGAVDSALGGPLAALRRVLARAPAARGRPALAAGAGCGVGVGYGYGVGLFAPPELGERLAARGRALVAALPWAGGGGGGESEGTADVAPPPPSPAALAARLDALAAALAGERARGDALAAREAALRAAFCERNRKHALCKQE